MVLFCFLIPRRWFDTVILLLQYIAGATESEIQANKIITTTTTTVCSAVCIATYNF